jgi:hypothetical protein
MAHQLKTYFKKFKTNQVGDIDLTGILNVVDYRKVNVCVIQGPHEPDIMTVECRMGKLSGQTLCQVVGQFPLRAAPHVHTFDVVGPEFSIDLTGGTHYTNVNIQAWVFLH